ncbi:MAG: hypothetical protein LBN21_00790 [Treponema sp.]|jgi:hypothetical protein|nr:hypothetical protein [Treponema sp.]
MLLTIPGYFESGKFVPNEPIKIPDHKKVILTVLEEESPVIPQPKPMAECLPPDDGSLAYLFRNYNDDMFREPVIDFGEAVGNEKW